jgi:hypothetical protein
VAITKAGFGTSAPTTGTWALGDRVYNTDAAIGQPSYWSCIAAGTPGTWLAVGVISQSREVYLETIADLRLLSPSVIHGAEVEGYYEANDGGGGVFHSHTGAAPGTYVDNGGTVIVPTGGDGSEAWMMNPSINVDIRNFGASTSLTNNSTFVQNMIDALGYFHVPAESFDCRDEILIPAAPGSIVGEPIYSGVSRTASKLNAVGMQGKSLIKYADPSLEYRFVFQDLSLGGDADIALNLTNIGGGITSGGDVRNCLLSSYGGPALKATNIFSSSFKNCRFSSTRDNGLDIPSGNTVSFYDCYVYDCGPNRASYRLVSGVLISCNSVNKSDIAIAGITQANPGVVRTSIVHRFATNNLARIKGVVGMTAVNLVAAQAPKTASAITNANPAKVTSNGHGFSNGDVVSIWQCRGMTQLNNNNFTVANVTANTFELQGVDSSAYGVYVANTAAILNAFGAEPGYRVYVPEYEITSITKANPAVVTAPGHPFVNGDTVRVRGRTSAILNITQANPAVVKSSNHGLTNGDQVIINGVNGMIQVNNLTHTVANATADTFELQGVDSTAYGAYTTVAPLHGEATRLYDGMWQIHNKTAVVAGVSGDTFQLTGINSLLYDSYVSGLVVSDAKRFSIGLDTTGQPAYTSGGYANEVDFGMWLGRTAEFYRVKIINSNIESWSYAALRLEGDGGAASLDVSSLLNRINNDYKTFVKVDSGNYHILTAGPECVTSAQGGTRTGLSNIHAYTSMSAITYDQSLGVTGGGSPIFGDFWSDFNRGATTVPVFGSVLAAFGVDALNTITKASREYGFVSVAPTTITANASTFSIASLNAVKTANTVATNLDGLTGGIDAQELRLLIKDANTTVRHNIGGAGKFLLTAGADYVAANGDVLVFVYNNSAWKQV